MYYDASNVYGWIDTPESDFRYNYLRGVAASLPAFAIGETWKLFLENWRLLGRHYESPTNFKQWRTFTGEVLKMENFRRGVGNRLQHASLISVFDYGLRWGVYRYCTEGYFKPYGAGDVHFWKKIVPTLFASLATSFFSIPFEIARACYYGDRTYPKELQKGYTSPLNALIRIPREEGPWYLFKGSFPIAARNFISFSFMAYLFDFLIDKFDPLRQTNSIPESWIKFFCVTSSAFMGTFVAYPFGVTVRNMAELWPETNGKQVFRGNYRKAAAWLWYQPFIGNHFIGFGNYCAKTLPSMWLTLYLADSLGLFTYWSHDQFTYRGGFSFEDSHD